MTTSTGSQPVKGRSRTLAQQEQRQAYRLLAIPILILIILILFPFVWNIVLSFQELRLIDLGDLSLRNLTFTLDNYAKVLGARGFGELLRTTVIYAVFGTILPIVLGLIAALLAREPFRGRQLFRGVLLFPYIAPIVAVTLVWKTMLNAQFGIINVWLQNIFGMQPISFLSTRSLPIEFLGLEFKWPVALTMVILFQGWRYFPFAFLFYLARLQALPEDLYEAGKIDGATLTQRFFRITLPQLGAVTAALVLLRFIWTFNKFDDIFLLTGGAAGTNVITVQIYNYLFGLSNVGAASALSIVLAGILAVLLFVYFRWFYIEEG
ncbi:MAG: sugar ABC transporter permease [Anaerolineae bacterium]|nr:sugar ABC transporter permease [Anaerolineae bacterium]MCB9131582.1 sugar ABC transporter permease [Anaerolineales bacterium]MCB0228528.1 sugar ABC transporter permease [Anaerolineae bacterium]MCB0233175.1 sugar ABC transporter permease [Anaerolineae bacterium]MCB0245046.1 sugar ABC transporter permease [Anaerolineae bacterium]